MPEGVPDIAYCHACGSPMDVSAVGPFTNVECPTCRKHTRVKREFGAYTLVRRHAIGGMSLVFVAQDNTLDREVVVKILSEEYSADEQRIGAFEEEARITAAISHPHVVRVFTTGRAFGRFYIAMEFVPGGHYEHHIRERGSIPEKEALPLAIEVVEGLRAAHKAGLIHRDVKPGNILLDGNGNAKIVDFGLALVTKGGKATASEIWATPYYVPPETIEGKEEDFRSDVYAFGATFYHALAGKPPCSEESMDTNRLRQAKQNLIPLTRAAPWISMATGAVMDRCMAYEPEHRFRSYSDLLTALKSAQQALVAGPAAPAKTPAQSLAAVRRPASKTGEKLALIFSTILVLGAVVFAIWWVGHDEGGDKPPGSSSTGAALPKPPKPSPGNTEGAGLRVAKRYREASEAVAKGEYDEARRLFGEVRNDNQALEPTASWAACEAVISCYLAGHSDDARNDARAALGHVQKAKGLNAGFAKIMEQGLRKPGSFEPVQAPEKFVGKGPRYLAWMISGLKNWDQGLLEKAKPFFEAVATAPTVGDDSWLQPYAKISKDYLADLRRLKDKEPKDIDLDPEGCRELIDELSRFRASLKTQGRARFNVACWQLDLENRARQLENEAQNPGRAGPLPKGTLADLRAGRFDEAMERLKEWEPEGPKQEKRREALVTLTEAASAFLSDLGERAAARGGRTAIVSRDGREFVGVSGSGERGISVKSADGREVSLQWSEVEPDSLIDLHRAMIRQESSELENMRRHEQAVAFDLLAGDPERARAAAERLGEDSESFKQRWVPLLEAVKN